MPIPFVLVQQHVRLTRSFKSNSIPFLPFGIGMGANQNNQNEFRMCRARARFSSIITRRCCNWMLCATSHRNGFPLVCAAHMMRHTWKEYIYIGNVVRERREKNERPSEEKEEEWEKNYKTNRAWMRRKKTNEHCAHTHTQSVIAALTILISFYWCDDLPLAYASRVSSCIRCLINLPSRT